MGEGEVKTSLEKARAKLVVLVEMLYVGTGTEKQRKEESQRIDDEK